MAIPNPAIFITASINNFLHLLKDDVFKEIIISSIKYLKERNLLTVYGFVIMPNHVHFIWREHDYQLCRKESPKASFFKYTGHKFLEVLSVNNPDLLRKFKVEKSDRVHQFWQRNPLEIEIYNDKVFEQKLNYIHDNPVHSKWHLVDKPFDYKYSSFRFYEMNEDDFGFLTNYYFD